MLLFVKKITPLYIPALHRELAPAELPQSVLFLSPGFLQAGADKAASGGVFQPDGLPFTGQAARALLREMLELGSRLSLGGKNAPGEELRLMESGARAAAAPKLGALNAAEKTELESFAGSGNFTPSGAPAPATPSTPENLAPSRAELTQAELIRAQKILLLAWELEENLLEIRRAEAILAQQDSLLLSALHGPESEQNGPNGEGAAAPAPVAWQLLLAAAAPFLPPDAVLFTASPELRAALAALSPPGELPQELADILAEILPENIGDKPGFAALLPQLSFAQARLGDLVGGKAAPGPGLETVHKFVLLPG